MYEKLNYLTSQVYPDYSEKTSAMRAPIIKLTIGDYLYRTPGVLESINITIEDNTSWEINQENEAYSGRKVAELPHYLNVSITFKPIMDILPRRAQDLTDIPALIANGNFIVDTLQKKQADTFKTEEQRKRQAAIDERQQAQDQKAAQKADENKVYQALIDFNTQQVRTLIQNPPTIPQTIDTSFLPETG
jgi:hypothetical protein